ncbi:MAG: hypothetical protein ABSH51_31890 [Solirubrobacteraceae bacterium]|jgi:hypothetical protein
MTPERAHDQSEQAEQTAPPRVPQPPDEPWPARLETGAQATFAWVSRPRVRLSLAGVALLALGALILTNSVWTLPIVVVGALMVVTAWIGHRLEGRFAIEWGQAGAQLSFRATIKPAHGPPELAARTLPAADPDPVAPGSSPAPEIIEGEAHTVEIDVGELKALIAAVETAQAPPADPPRPDIRIRRA